MTLRDVLTAFAAAIVWGLTFIAIKFGVTEAPPLALDYGLRSRQLAHRPATAVTPFALLAPIVGMIAGWMAFAEPREAFEDWGAVLVMAGLAVNVFGDRVLALRLRPAG